MPWPSERASRGTSLPRRAASAGLSVAIGLLSFLGGPSCQRPEAAPAPAPPAGTLTYQRAGNIYTLSLDTRTEREITDFPAASAALFQARSPDAVRLALVRLSGQGWSLSVKDLPSGEERTLVDDTLGHSSLTRPQWTADARGLVYTRHEFTIVDGAVRGATSHAERIAGAGGDRQVIADEVEDPAVASDGRTAFVRWTTAGRQLVVASPDGAESVLAVGFADLAAPRFSPDGRQIAFVAVSAPADQATPPRGALHWGAPIAQAHGLPWGVWITGLDGSPRRLGTLEEDEPTLAWSPDGSHLAVSGATGVYVMDVARGEATRFLNMGGFGGIDWTP
jgi:Tol biopolymer transport system component